MLRRTFLSLTAALASLMALPATAQQSDQPAPGAAMLPAPSKSGYAPVNGVEVYYAVYGEGDPLVLLHGGLANIDMFGPNVALLAQGRQVIAIDLQGHGHTLPFDRPMSYEAMADDVAGVIQYLGFEKADLMGYSLGGGTALRVAIQHPELVDRLVAVSAPYAWAGWHDYNQQGMRSMTPDMAEGMKGTPLYESYAAVAPDVNNFPVLIEQVTAMMMHDFDWAAEVREIEAPTLLMFADWDAVRTSHVASFFELLGGGLQDALWDGSGMNANRLASSPMPLITTSSTTPVPAKPPSPSSMPPRNRPRRDSSKARHCRAFYWANLRAPITHRMTATVTSSMIGVTSSRSNVAASARPKNGCSNCNWPTAAMPPWARPRYQKTKPINMLKSET